MKRLMTAQEHTRHGKLLDRHAQLKIAVQDSIGAIDGRGLKKNSTALEAAYHELVAFQKPFGLDGRI